MSQSVKERAFSALLKSGKRNLSTDEAVDAIAAAGLLLDERAEKCVEACKAHHRKHPKPGAVWTNGLWACDDCSIAGAAYDAPKRSQADVVADLVAEWKPGATTRAKVATLLDELAALTRAEGGK